MLYLWQNLYRNTVNCQNIITKIVEVLKTIEKKQNFYPKRCIYLYIYIYMYIDIDR